MFVLLTSISQYISEIVLFSEYEIMTGRLVNTKLLGFRLLWDVTVYVIDRQNCPTAADLANACRTGTSTRTKIDVKVTKRARNRYRSPIFFTLTFLRRGLTSHG